MEWRYVIIRYSKYGAVLDSIGGGGKVKRAEGSASLKRKLKFTRRQF